MPSPVGLQGLPHTMKQEFVEARKAEMVRQINLAQWPLIKWKSKPLAVVYGAWDCPYSKKMEADFRRAGISYYLVPLGLNPQSNAIAQTLYGNPNFQQVWQDLITKGTTEATIQGNGAYPVDDANDLAFLFMFHGQSTPKTPIVIFSDGSMVEGWDSKRFMPIANKHLSQQHFFA
ncbi:hypothetical protein CBR67_17685 [Bordetella hinzii]|nr:hypothetical protein CBR67_17685 [Bordetella hinzii]